MTSGQSGPGINGNEEATQYNIEFQNWSITTRCNGLISRTFYVGRGTYPSSGYSVWVFYAPPTIEFREGNYQILHVGKPSRSYFFSHCWGIGVMRKSETEEWYGEGVLPRIHAEDSPYDKFATSSLRSHSTNQKIPGLFPTLSVIFSHGELFPGNRIKITCRGLN